MDITESSAIVHVCSICTCTYTIIPCTYTVLYQSILRYAHVGLLYVSINKYGETALHVASGADQSAVVTLLLDHGADLHARTRVGDCRTALTYVCRISLKHYGGYSLIYMITVLHFTVQGNSSPLCQ